MNYNIDLNWDLFFSQVDLIHDDKPVFIKNFLPNYKKFLSWDTVEKSINRYNCKIDLLDPNDGSKFIPIPTYPNMYGEHLQDKKFIFDKINKGYTFMARGYSFSHPYLSLLCSEINNKFKTNSEAQFLGSKGNLSNSFNDHCDETPILIFQTFGQIKWTVYDNKISSLFPREITNTNIKTNKLTNPTTFTLSPGDFLYLPNRTYHKITLKEPRLTISISCFPIRFTNLIDRNYYNL